MASDKKIRALLSPKMETALKAATSALKKAKVKFALVGGLALDYHATEPRFTSDLDFVIDAEDWKRATSAVKAVGFPREPGGFQNEMLANLENKDGVGVDLMFGVGDPEENARKTARRGKLLGVQLPIARPEFLLWMYLVSDQRRHEEDAEQLIRSGKVSVRAVAAYLRLSGSRFELTKLAGIVARLRDRR